MAYDSQAVTRTPSRQAFKNYFRKRYEYMNGIENNTSFFCLIPKAYEPYYRGYIQRWGWWMRGYYPLLHNTDFFSMGVGYTVCEAIAKECMNGGYRYTSKDNNLKEFMENWESDDLADIFSKMFFLSAGLGNAILALQFVDGEIYPTVYPIDRVLFSVDRRGKIRKAVIFNRFIAGETNYYVRETRIMKDGKGYYMAEMAQFALVNSPHFDKTSTLKEIPEEVKDEFEDCYGDIELNTWYSVPERISGLGLYNVKNKALAVAIKDLPGYSDSSLATCGDILYALDYNYTQGMVDQYMGRSRAVVPKRYRKISINNPEIIGQGVSFGEALETDETLQDSIYDKIESDNLDNGKGDKIDFLQPSLRGEERKHIRDSELEMLASKVGLSSSDLANHLSKNVAKTAFEVNRERGTTQKTVEEKRRLANIAINDMLKDVATFYGYADEITIEWGKTAISNDEIDLLMREYQKGLMTLEDYVKARWEDLSEAEIQDKVERLKIEQERKAEVQRSAYEMDEVDEQGGQAY